MVKDADTIILTDLTNKVSVPIGMDQSPIGLSGKDTKEIIEQTVTRAQTCQSCLEYVPSQNINLPHDITCENVRIDCLDTGTVCGACQEAGHEYIEPQLRHCHKCL